MILLWCSDILTQKSVTLEIPHFCFKSRTQHEKIQQKLDVLISQLFSTPMLNKSSKQSATNIEYLSTKSIVLINVVTFKTNFQPNAILGFVTLLISIRKMYEENQLL